MAALLTDGGTLALGLGFGAASMLSVGPNNLMLIREGLETPLRISDAFSW